MRRPLVVCGLLALAVALGAGIAVAHGNHATAHSQVSANGTLVVEQAFLTEPGYLVVRADDGGTPGAVLGARRLSRGFYTGITVDIDGQHWRTLSDTATVWTVLHADDGDDQFDPASDSLLYWFGEPAGTTIQVRKGDGAAYVVTGSSANTTDAVVVPQVALPSSGHVVVHEQQNGSLGQVYGSTALTGGHHDDVRIPVDLSGPRSSWPGLTVAIHTDDGDGTFDAADPVVRVGDEPVASPLGRTVAPSTGTPGIVTPTATTTPDETARESGGSTAAPTSDASGRGFGAGLALVAVVVVVAVARRRT